MIASSRSASVGSAIAIALAFHLGSVMLADGPTLKLRAVASGVATTDVPLTIELFRWSTDAERAPLLAALSAPPPAPPTESAAPAAGRAGRGGRGGRGAAPPLSPLAKLTGAVKAAPTLGYIWGDGVTGYSIKYAWRSPATDGAERIVLAVDRRLGAHVPDWQVSSAAADADFTLIEMRIDGKGVGEGKTSLTAAIVVDGAGSTLALDDYAAAPALLKVTR
jgi:hypothetical protein